MGNGCLSPGAQALLAEMRRCGPIVVPTASGRMTALLWAMQELLAAGLVRERRAFEAVGDPEERDGRLA